MNLDIWKTPCQPLTELWNRFKSDMRPKGRKFHHVLQNRTPQSTDIDAIGLWPQYTLHNCDCLPIIIRSLFSPLKLPISRGHSIADSTDCGEKSHLFAHRYPRATPQLVITRP